MVLKINNTISAISCVSSSEHDVNRINSIEVRYKGERGESKAPTFRPDLPRHLAHPDEELWLLERESSDGREPFQGTLQSQYRLGKYQAEPSSTGRIRHRRIWSAS